MDSCFSSSSDTYTQLLWLQSLAPPLDDMVVSNHIIELVCNRL